MSNFLYAARPVLFDSLGVILFAVLMALKVDIAVAAGLAIVASVAVVGWELVRRRPVETLQWISLGLVLVSAGAAMLTHDPRFVMAKPTLIYAVIGFSMLKRGWMLRYAPPAARDAEDVMIKFGYVWAGLMFVTGAANLVVALLYPARWIAFMAVVPIASKVGLFLVQYFITRAVVIARMNRAKVQPAAAI